MSYTLGEGADGRIHDYTVRTKSKDVKEPTPRIKERDMADGNVDRGAIAGPGPSTMASRQAQSTSPTIGSSTPTSRNIDQDQIHINTDHPNQELEHLATELEELMGRDDIVEVADEVADPTIIDQLFERIHTESENTRHKLAEEEEWIEVDRVLDGEDTSFNGAEPIRPISLDDATDHTRLHTVLQNMTRRIKNRRQSWDTKHSDMESGRTPGSQSQTPTASPSPESSPSKSSPSKRSSPFKALVHAKSAFARRLRFGSKPTGDDVEHGDISEELAEHKPTIKSESPALVDTSTTTGYNQSVESPETEEELPKDEKPDLLFPHDTLIANLHRFMRYSSAAYGVRLSYA